MPQIDLAKVIQSGEAEEELKRLIEKHRKCEARLTELQTRLLLSAEEKVEEITLKKQKLVLKDRMESLRAHLGTGGTSQSG